MDIIIVNLQRKWGTTAKGYRAAGRVLNVHPDTIKRRLSETGWYQDDTHLIIEGFEEKQQPRGRSAK